jgi:predicted P-loop ATPase
MSLFSISKKLVECNTLIQQLEAQNQLLHQNLELATSTKEASEESRYEQRKMGFLRPIREMADFVDREFEFRHNVIRDAYEYRRRSGGAAEWLPVDERQMNTIMNRVQDDGRVYCLKSLVQQRIRSEMARDYHPVAEWLDAVRGTWDGTDRVGPLAARINATDYCQRMLRIWLRAVVAQWLGVDDRHANAVMLLLVSERQGLHKSTFFHELLPDELESYYTDDFNLASKGNAERKLVEFALVNIDEFDKLPVKKMPDLKTLMQTLRPSFVKAYKTNFNLLPRIASFVGTSNSRQLLTDRTGSRRFLILEPDGLINVDDIDHRQLYAQLVEEVERGCRYHFTKDEEQEMQRVNEQYYKPNPLEDLFTRFFRAPQEDEPCLQLSASQLMSQLSRRSPSLLRTVSETAFGKMLRRLGIPKDHQHDGNVYRVVTL